MLGGALAGRERTRAAREDILRTYRGDMPCLIGAIGWFADWGVRENERFAPTGIVTFSK
jgi:hypothetical protein